MDNPRAITVSFGEVSRTMSPGEEATFGRSVECVFRVDPADIAISRLAGVVLAENNAWFVVNLSRTGKLDVLDDLGLRSALAPGRRCALQGDMRILLQGNKKHEIAVHAPPVDTPVIEDEPEGQPTSLGESVSLTPAEHVILVALFASYLRNEQGTPHPTTYDAVAVRLGMPSSTVRKKVEYLRKRLTKAGVPNMDGRDALLNLGEYALAKRLITKDDLRLL